MQCSSRPSLSASPAATSTIDLRERIDSCVLKENRVPDKRWARAAIASKHIRSRRDERTQTAEQIIAAAERAL